jgi:hypothetical protein
MADKKLEFSDNLGDIDSILHNQSVSDLSWLAVDEAAYRASEALPKQNLDIIPELTHALAYSPEDDIQRVIPMRPHVMVNQNPLSHQNFPVDMTTPIRNRVAMMVMEGLPKSEIKEKLLLEYAPADIHVASGAIQEVLNESGLLGNVYIDSNHFPRCSQGLAKDRKIVAGCAKRSLYVLSKPDCSGCVKNVNGTCTSFQKTLVATVPYGSKLAAHYAPSLASEKRADALMLEGETWKKRLKLAFSSPIQTVNPDGVKTSHTQIKKAVQVTEDDISQYVNRKYSAGSVLSSEFVKLSRRMMDGKNDLEKLSSSDAPDLRFLASQFGILGHTYLDMDVLGGCKKTASFISSKNLRPDFLIRRSASCAHCKNLSDGGCASLCRSYPVYESIPALDQNHFVAAMQKAVDEGRISENDMALASSRLASVTNWDSLISQINLFKPKSATSSYTGSKYSAFRGSSSPSLEVDAEEVRRFISHLMNTGLSGLPLQRAILSRYTKEDLKQVPQVGNRIASGEHVQGSFYIDPTAYNDYGRGCSEGSSIFKNRNPRNILASSQCTGCTMQTAPGWCSKYCKSLIRSVPASVRNASVPNSLPVYHEPVENPVEKYELASESSVDLNGARSKSLDITLDAYSIDE